jgi:hypothetical protein
MLIAKAAVKLLHTALIFCVDVHEIVGYFASVVDLFVIDIKA